MVKGHALYDTCYSHQYSDNVVEDIHAELTRPLERLIMRQCA